MRLTHKYRTEPPDHDLLVFDFVRLVKFALETVDLMVTTIESLIGPSGRPASIDLSPIQLGRLANMLISFLTHEEPIASLLTRLLHFHRNTDNIHGTLQDYQRSLPIGYFSINLLGLLNTQPPLPLRTWTFT